MLINILKKLRGRKIAQKGGEIFPNVLPKHKAVLGKFL